MLYLDKIYGEMKPYHILNETILFFWNNTLQVELTKKELYINHDTLWSDVMYMFSLDDITTGDIITHWLDKKYKYKELPTYNMVKNNITPDNEWKNRNLQPFGFRYSITSKCSFFGLTDIEYDR